MQARCPECGTRFRVHPKQLGVAGGRVRCGRCQCVFDARPHANEPMASSYPAEQEVELTAPLIPGSPPARSRTGQGAWATALWSLSVIVLALALVLQAIWWDRHTLAAHRDGLPLVQWLCRFAPCKLKLPKATERILVLERTLEPHPERPDALRFHLRMTNQADQAQPYPIVELRVLDRLERLAGIRRFTPDQYLPQDSADVMPQDTPTEISLELANPGEHIIGFQIDFL